MFVNWSDLWSPRLTRTRKISVKNLHTLSSRTSAERRQTGSMCCLTPSRDKWSKLIPFRILFWSVNIVSSLCSIQCLSMGYSCRWFTLSKINFGWRILLVFRWGMQYVRQNLPERRKKCFKLSVKNGPDGGIVIVKSHWANGNKSATSVGSFSNVAKSNCQHGMLICCVKRLQERNSGVRQD